ncbi:MAG: DUF2721 domain-containing protein [Leptolyngbyaceae cyanobacterium RM2_2_4]|nr:DUF2721 domain-containing protein [Leptolyngbyaceae cyanobacterium SM1_4_3]NJN91711.1 DUF2721 domain-containing protein [Leptolyngbyaceae cyanobacterium SL_5_14]NJO49778.1 DUF2721 domain-containing protein [Leptolyngbyaceae cyanobacterium RM2_2_4]NJO66888.1 DUF2721 domain-containing protein [Leptolyngbyaceae cyanobacterium RM1_405_57]
MMSAADIAQTIQLIIAPVVLITACMLFQNGVLARYASLGQRIRSLSHERFELLRSGKEDMFNLERLQAIDRQLPLLTLRHRLIQRSALLAYGAIAIFIFTMFAIALSVALQAGIVGSIALILFLIGTGVLLVGIFLIGLEIRMSHRAICYEVHQVTLLGK